MEHTARVHRLFRGASEVAKTFRNLALTSDLVAAAIALISIILKPKDSAVWLPFTILLLSILGSALRAYSSTANGFAQRCRRISLRAYCVGKDVDHQTLTLLEDDTPAFVEMSVKRLPAKSIDEYYEPTTLPGQMRRTELYAHSAYYTWHLLRLQAWIIFSIASLVFLGCSILIFHLAADQTVQLVRQSVLEAICTVVLIVFGVKALEAWWQAYSSYREVWLIETELINSTRAYEAQQMPATAESEIKKLLPAIS